MSESERNTYISQLNIQVAERRIAELRDSIRNCQEMQNNIPLNNWKERYYYEIIINEYRLTMEYYIHLYNNSQEIIDQEFF